MNDSPECGVSKLTGRIREQGGMAPLAAWVRITDENGDVIRDTHIHDTLRGFPCTGTFEVDLAPGRYEVAIHRHVSHEWFVTTLVCEGGRDQTLDVKLKPWVDPWRRGFFSGESHDHLNHPNEGPAVATYCEALGISYLDVCQSWMTKRSKDRIITGEEISRQLESQSTDTFHMYFGAERPKKRFGHVWWTNLPPFEDPFGEYMGWHDADYVSFCMLPHASAEVDVEALCPSVLGEPFTTWNRHRRRGAVGVSAHPTSWWVDNDDQKLIHTNIAADMVYALLAGCAVDAIVAMGYDPEQPFYQSVWFHLLNEGYRLPACAETDGNLKGHHHIGQIIGYTRTRSGHYSRDGIAEGIRSGRTLMTSGPFILFSADDNRYQMGDEILLDQPDHQLEIEAWSDPDPSEFLSGLVVYRNGLPFLVKDLRHEKPRHYRLVIPVTESQCRAWYVVKAYGSRYPADDRFTDVFAYTTLCEHELHAEYRDLTQVALTNPIYFIPRGWTPPAPVTCHLHLKTVPGAHVVITELGEKRQALVADAEGRVEAEVSPVAEVTITTGTCAPLHRSIFLHYRPVAKLVEYCYTGQWRAHTQSGMQPGQVPWWGFRFEALRTELHSINWEIQPA